MSLVLKRVLEHKMNYDMNLIQSWLSANKLTLNVKKTKYMLIGSQFKLSQINNDFTVKVNNTTLERVIKQKSLAGKLQKMQNKAPRILTLSNYEVRSSVLLDEFRWKRLEYVRPCVRQLAVTMYKIHNNLSLSYLMRIFTNTSNVRSHNLRNSELNYYIPRPRTESAKGSLHYRGSVLWNKILSEIRKLPSLNVFKTS